MNKKTFVAENGSINEMSHASGNIVKKKERRNKC